MARTYWLDLFTLETWQEFIAHGGDVSGFAATRWKTVQKMRPGDQLLCYVTRASRWIGLLEVTGNPFYDEAPIWQSQVFPSRVPVKILIALKPEHAVPVLNMRHQLTVFDGLANPNLWSGPFRGSPARWKQIDGDAVIRALEDAASNPIERPLGRAAGRGGHTSSVTIDTEQGVVTVPEDDAKIEPKDQSKTEKETDGGRVHTEIQYMLLKLGVDMGFNVHVARNDVSQEWGGRKFADLPRMQASLPNQFDPITNRTVELIDVLWLQGNAIVAAFEIESTTSIYSGLLRMSDLVSMQPNISVPLFLVAGDERRGKVIEQVNRPTFSRISPPLPEICRYISFDVLREALDNTKDLVRYLKPEWLQEIREPCDVT